MNIFLISGEPSGDGHAARLVSALRKRVPDAHFAGLGGNEMKQAGVRIYRDYNEMAFMGIVAVLKNIRSVRENFRIAKDALLKENPDVLILVDYPSFNLRIAAFCRKHLPATKIVWYIPPKIWAWKRWRVHRVVRLSDEICGIFPFEPEFYSRYGYSCRYVGNPTEEECSEWLRHNNQRKHRPVSDIIAVLPGSRRSEIEHCLGKMVAAARSAAPTKQVIIAGAPSQPKELYQRLAPNAKVVFGETYSLLASADAAVVNSGTATLEAALLGCPEVAVYHIAVPHAVTFASLLFSNPVGEEKKPFFTLPNILTGKEVVKELIGSRFTVEAVAAELRSLLADCNYRAQQTDGYKEIRHLLGKHKASNNAAEVIIQQL
ncbi:MAG: lipid-A-disaccharide synthase [Paludibacteraceae bacterium]|nr:lipid-A-disaccharide synthase [Paludibacteraceae bacterium]